MSNRPRDDTRSLVAHLFDSYGESLYRYAVLLLADPEAAEDVVQEVFVRILGGAHRLAEEENYLRRAIRNECYSQLRRRRRRNELAPESRFMEPIVEGVGADERMALERAIRDLPAEQREVIYLHVFEGLTFQEIANTSDDSINTITARYRYALAKLKRVLTLP